MRGSQKLTCESAGKVDGASRSDGVVGSFESSTRAGACARGEPIHRFTWGHYARRADARGPINLRSPCEGDLLPPPIFWRSYREGIGAVPCGDGGSLQRRARMRRMGLHECK